MNKILLTFVLLISVSVCELFARTDSNHTRSEVSQTRRASNQAKKLMLDTLMRQECSDGYVSLYVNEDAQPRQRKKVGVVLSGGGAKGTAHVTVLRAIEEAGIPIDYIAGTSMGAIVGGLYAIGYTTYQLDSLLRAQDWVSLLADRVSRRNQLMNEKENADRYILRVPFSFQNKFQMPSGILAGQNVLNLLNELTIGYHAPNLNFDSLPIPFACVAYDMYAGKEVVLREGNLPLAIRTSMSIPGAFTPVFRDSMVLVDGGIYNNFPVDVVRDMGAEIIIGVDVALGVPDDPAHVNSIMGLIDQITNIMGRERYTINRYDTDVYIHPRIKPYTSGSYNTEAIDSLLSRGTEAGRAHFDELLALREKIGLPEDYRTEVRPPLHLHEDSLTIGKIEFEGLSRNEESLIRQSLKISEDSRITRNELNRVISDLMGSGAFDYVTFNLDTEASNTLTIIVNEKPEMMLNVGFRFDSEQMAAILLNTTIQLRGLRGPALSTTIRLNDNPYGKLQFMTPSSFLGRMALSYMFRYNNYKLYDHGKKVNTIEAGQHTLDLYFTAPNLLKLDFSIGARYEYIDYDSFLFAADREIIPVESEGFINYYANIHYESFDNAFYPLEGSYIHVEGMLYTDDGYRYNKQAPFGSLTYSFITALSPNMRLTFIPAVYGRTVFGENPAYPYLNYIGGEIRGRYINQQMPFVGVPNIEHVANSYLSASLEIRGRLWKRNYFSLVGSYGIQNNDFIDMFSERGTIWGVGIKYSFNSPIGPISLQIDHSNLTKFGFYFSLGKTF